MNQNQPLGNPEQSSSTNPNKKIYGIIAIIVVSLFVIIVGIFYFIVYISQM